MSRNPVEVENTQVIVGDGRIYDAMQSVNELAVMEHEAHSNAAAIARQIGYDGTLTVGALEDGIRFYRQRTVEACLELGKRLLILKELTPHGEFKPRIELLGIQYRMAAKFMSATLKFSKVNSNSLLKASQSQTKLLELVILDEGEIEALENGDTVRGITLDDIERMSVSELKKSLRNAREDIKATEAVLQKKDEKLNALDKELEKQRNAIDERAMPGEQEIVNLQSLTLGVTSKITARMNGEILKLVEAAREPGGTLPKHIRLAIAQSIGLIITAAQGVSDNWQIEPITDPDTAADDPAKADAEAFLQWDAQQSGE